MRVLFIVLAFIWAVQADPITWNAADSVNNTWWSNGLNWSGGVAPGSTDTCIFDVTGGSKAPNTATQGLTNAFASIRITNAYTRAWSWNGTRAFQLSNDFIDDGVTGLHVLGTSVTMNGATSIYHVGSGVNSGFSASATTLIFNGSGCTLDQDLASVYYKRVNIGSSAGVTNSGSASLGITAAASDTSVKMGANSSLNLTTNLLLYTPGANSVLWSVDPTSTISGSGNVTVLTATTPYIVPYANFGTSNSVTFTAYASGTFNIIGNLSFGIASGKGHFVNTNSASTTVRWINTNSNITAHTLQLGSSHASGAVVASYGSGIYYLSILDLSTKNSGANIDSFQTLNGHLSGSMLIGTGHQIVPGTSSWTMDSAGILLTNGKDLYDFIFDPGAGQTDSVVDSAGSYHNVSVLSGKLKPLTAGFNLTGNLLLLGGADTLFGNRANAKWIRLANTATVQITNTNIQRLLDSLKFHFVNGGTFSQDSVNRVKRVVLSSGAGGKKLAIQAGKSLSINGYQPGDFSGVSGALDSTISTTQGVTAKMATTVPQCDSFRFVQDQEAQGYPAKCTTGCVDGGGNVNWAFDRPLVNYTIPASLPPTGGRVILQGTYFRSSGGSVTIDGIPAALIAQHDNWASFIAPAHVVGTVWIIYSNGTGTDSVQFIYNTDPLTDSTIIGVIAGQSNGQGAGVLHASRDTAKTDSALGYRRTDIQNLEGTWMRCIDPMVGSNASMGPSFSTSLVRYLRKPVALINAARITSNLVGYYWHKSISWGMRNPDNPWDSTYMYGKEISFILNGLRGRKPAFFEWYQGETECFYPKDSINVYPTRFDTLRARMISDLELDSLPTFIVQVSVDSSTTSIPYDTNFTNMRNMQYGLDRGSNVVFGAVTYDLDGGNQFHLTYKGQDSLGPRLAAAYVRYRNGMRSPYPHLTAVTTSGDSLVLQFNSPLRPSTTSVSGFVLDSAGVPATIIAAVVSGMQLKLLTSRTETFLNTRYMIGRLPDVTYPLRSHAGLPVLPIGTKRAVGWVDRAGRLITNLRNDWLKPGDTLNITGAGFGASQGIGTIKCNSISLGTAPTWTNTSIAIPIPVITRGYYDLIVTTALGVSDTVAYGLKIFRPEAH